MLLCIFNLLLFYRRKSSSSSNKLASKQAETTTIDKPVDKLIEAERAETGSVSILLTSILSHPRDI